MPEPRVRKVSVAHCDLRQANYPVAVGHYRGDVIVHAPDWTPCSTACCGADSISEFIRARLGLRRLSEPARIRPERSSWALARSAN